MKRSEWQKHHGFCDQDMAEIDGLKKFFNGSIISVGDVLFNQRQKECRSLIEAWPDFTERTKK